ncbi:MAG: hypothetical protein PUP91_17760 [Rhizonema sp. PD37]|nr:hypothetical protein [Rhizonema sp. PD37]
MVLLEKRKRRTGGFLLAFALATFGLHLFVLFLLIFQGLTIRKISLEKSPTFVQLIDDKPVTVTDDMAREPEAIRQFVSQTMTSMFNWSGTLPAQSIEQATRPLFDPGVSIRTPQGFSRKVSTSSWIASFALSEDFRKGFLSTIAEITPPEVFSNNSSQALSSQLIIKRVYPPEKIGPGKWRIGMVADLIQKKRSEENKKVIVPFNKDLLVRAVDTYVSPLTNTATDLQRAVYSVRSAKMEIYEIRNLCLLDEDNASNGGSGRSCSPGSSGSFIK